MADTFFGFVRFIIFPFRLRAYKLHGRESATQVGFASFPFHRKRRVFRTTGNTIFIQRAARFRNGNSSVKWNIRFLTRSIPKQIFVDFNGIEIYISQKSIGVYQWMFFEKVLIIKADVPDNAKPVCKDAKSESIAEMSVDVHLFYGRISGGVGRHGAISGLVRVIGIRETFCLFKDFELSDDTVCILGIVFGDPCLNAGGIKEQHGCFFLINMPAYRFGQIDKVIEHRL